MIRGSIYSFDNDDMKTGFFFIIDFCFKMYFKIDSYKI